VSLYPRATAYGEPITLAVLALTTAAVTLTGKAVQARATAKARRESFSGLLAQRDAIQRKLAKASGARRRARLERELREVENKVRPMERALVAEEAAARAAEAEAIAANAKIHIDAKQVSAQIEHQVQMRQFWSRQFPLYAGAGAVVVLVGVGLYAASR